MTCNSTHTPAAKPASLSSATGFDAKHLQPHACALQVPSSTICWAAVEKAQKFMGPWVEGGYVSGGH